MAVDATVAERPDRLLARCRRQLASASHPLRHRSTAAAAGGPLALLGAPGAQGNYAPAFVCEYIEMATTHGGAQRKRARPGARPDLGGSAWGYQRHFRE